MRISTRGRYALRAMVDLAENGGGEPVLRSDLAARQDISAEYIAQIFKDLREAGLVLATKGPGGGYMLAKAASSIRAGDVIRAVEGPIAAVHCVLDKGETRCQRIDTCTTHSLWKGLTRAVADYLNGITLEDLRTGQVRELDL
ncbi:MAG: Rrf2 family transcriptional regulator [Anaerolineales bacterium]|nr:Rrf2 family transcriptional regulator [Anaerolineales bacterium]